MGVIVRQLDEQRSMVGMTLIEVLVALAIVAITLSAGMKAAGGLTLNAQRVSDLTVGQWCIENQLFVLKASATFPDVGDSEFKCQQLGREFKGKQAVRPTVNANNFRRIEVQMLDEEGQSVVKVITVLPRP